MNKNKLLVCLAAVLIAAVACMCMLFEEQEPPLGFCVRAGAEGKTEQIRCWQGDDGTYCVFLPSYADLAQTKVVLPENTQVRINGISLTDGMYCDGLELGVAYTYSDSAWRTGADSIVFYRSAGVPAVYVDTQSGRMDYIHENKDNQESGTIRVYTDTGRTDYEGAVAALQGRGNSSWEGYEKKPYNLQLAQKGDLLGMGGAYNWVLLANASDPSHMRNQIVFDFSRALGLEYAPDAVWVDVYLNGSYAGLYLLCERNEADPARVAIDQEGSLLLSQELESRLSGGKAPYVITAGEQTFRIRYPLAVSDTAAQQILHRVQSVENALLAPDGTDPVTGKSWQELIDLDSWVKKYLVEEVFANMDASYLSQYFYIDGNGRDAKLYAGPVWDYDLSMGNRVQWQLTSPNVMLANRLSVRQGVETPWFHTLYTRPEFHGRLQTLFEQTLLPAMQVLLETGLDDYADAVAAAARMDQLRWKDADRTFETEVAGIREYLTARTAFLKTLWLEETAYHLVRAEDSFGTNYTYYAVVSGESLTQLPELEDTQTARFVGWYYADTQEPVDPTAPVCTDMAVYARWETTDTQWRSRLMELLPLGVFAVLFAGFFAAAAKRIRRER